MNNSIVIKNADFSVSKVDKINLVKLSVTNAGNGYYDISGDQLSLITSALWGDPTQECAHSAEITLPVGTAALFGVSNKTVLTSDFNTWMATPDNGILNGALVKPWCFHRSGTDTWQSLGGNYYNGVENRPNIIKYKQGLYLGSNYTLAVYDGPIFGNPFPLPDIDKVVINWFRADAVAGRECGIALPEIYAYVP